MLDFQLGPLKLRSRVFAGSLFSIMLVIVAVLSGCASNPPSSSGYSLQWVSASLPPGFTASVPAGAGLAFAITPTNGNIAYACVVPEGESSPRVTVWITHDRAAHWTQIGTALPAPKPVTHCLVRLDDFESNVLVVELDWSLPEQGSTPAMSVSYVTADGGDHWQRLGGSTTLSIGALATRDGYVVALRNMQDTSGNPTFSLAVSTDHFHSWHPIDRAIVESGSIVNRFWLDPGSSMILASASHGTELWSSPDLGVHWKELPLSSPLPGSFSVQFTSSGHANICKWYYDAASGPAAPNALTCSTDGGTTWVSRPGLDTPVSESGRTLVAPTVPLGFDASGALIGLEWEEPHITGVFRLPKAGDTWELLGKIPYEAFQLDASFAPGSTSLWALPIGASEDGKPLVVASYTP